MVLPLILVFLISFLLSRGVLFASERAGVVDMPDFRRKVNSYPIPKLGGIAFFIAFFSVLTPLASPSGINSALLSALLCGGGMSLLFGAADDFFDLPPTVKLLSQTAVASVSLLLLEGGRAPSPLPFVFIVFMMNAYNLLDGLDGLCASVSLSSLLFFALSDLVLFNTGVGYAAILLFFALLGFLPYNAPPARLYMGECGAATLGLSISLFALHAPTSAILPQILFSFLPVCDTLYAFLRRSIAGRSPFSADRGHLHHRLLDRGLSHCAAVNVLLLLSISVSLICFGLCLALLPKN